MPTEGEPINVGIEKNVGNDGEQRFTSTPTPERSPDMEEPEGTWFRLRAEMRRYLSSEIKKVYRESGTPIDNALTLGAFLKVAEKLGNYFDRFLGQIDLPSDEETQRMLLQEPDLPIGFRQAITDFLQVYRRDCKDIEAKVGSISGEVFFEKTLGFKPKGTVGLKREFDSIAVTFSEAEDEQTFCDRRGLRLSVGGFVGDSEVLDTQIVVVRDFSQNTGPDQVGWSKRGKPERRVIELHERSHILNSLFYESEIQPIEEANDENDLFSRTQNLWLEKFKNEVLAYFTSGSIGDGYVTLEPLVKKDGLYDYPKEYYESVKKIYAEKFADRSDFDVKYEAEVRRYWETVKKTASDMVSLFMGYAYEYDMESDYGDYEEAYNTDQGARSLRLLKLFTLFPGKSWGNLLSRIHQCADEWEKLRNIYPNTEGVDDEDTSESDLRSSEWIVSQIGEKFLPLWKALIDRELIKKGRKPRSIYIAYGNVVDNLESEIPDGSVNAEHLFELADHVDDSTAFDSSHFWDTFVSEVGHYFDPDEYNDWHGLLPLSRAEAAEIYIDATKRITTYLAENASHYAEKIVELEDLVDAHCYQHGIDPESLYAAA